MGRPRILQDRRGVAYSTPPFDAVRWSPTRDGCEDAPGNAVFHRECRVLRARSRRRIERLQRADATAAPAAATRRLRLPQTRGGVGCAHVTRFIEAHFAANPAARSTPGRHEFDGRLPDLSAAGLAARRGASRDGARTRRLRSIRPALRRSGSASATTCWPRSRSNSSGRKKPNGRTATRRTTSASSTRRSTSASLTRRSSSACAPTSPMRVKSRALRRQIRANLRTPMPAPWIDYGVNAFGGFAEFFSNDVAAVFSGVKDPALQADAGTGQCRRRQRPCRALGGLARVPNVRARRRNFALGAELFARMLGRDGAGPAAARSGCRKSAAPISSATSRRCACLQRICAAARPLRQVRRHGQQP